MSSSPTDLETGAPSGPLLDEQGLARIAKALGHAERIRILGKFADGRPHTVGEIVDASPLAQSTISEHLKILRTAGVLHAQRDGPRTWYIIQRDLLRVFALEVERMSLASPLSGAPFGLAGIPA
jgi:ArsR family transcriptional regulator